MPATTSALIALRLSGRLMVIQSACPRFSRITLLWSVIVPLACLPYVGEHLRQDGGGLQGRFFDGAAVGYFAIVPAYFTRRPLKNPALVVFCLMLAVSPCSAEF